MELQRNQATLDFWELAADFTAVEEEHAELIVPDHSPDIAKILSAEGNVFLRSSEMRDGKATLSGTVQVSVLYIPEKSALVQSVSYSLPFQMSEACPQDCTVIHPALALEDLSARMLNPRKLRLQCRVSANISAYRFLSAGYTCGVTADQELCLELKPQQETVSIVTAIAEKDFSYQDTLRLPQNRGAVAAVLCSSIHSTVEDAKIIGTKAVVKGRYLAAFLLKYDSGACENSCFDLPFSHIADLDAPQDAVLSASLITTNLTAEPIGNDDDGSELRISVESRLQLAVSEMRELTVIEDLYSTAFDLTTERQELRLLDAAEVQIRRQVWQDTLEIGVPAERVLLISASCGPVTQGSGELPELRTTLRLHALYLTEDGRILSAERSAEVSQPCADAAESLRCWASCGEEISSVMTTDGMVLRIPVDFHLKPRRFHSVSYVSAINFDEKAIQDAENQPSLVLRKKRREESLWEMAKRHGSTVRDILSANGCAAEDELPADRMILIPRRRA